MSVIARGGKPLRLAYGSATRPAAVVYVDHTLDVIGIRSRTDDSIWTSLTLPIPLDIWRHWRNLGRRRRR